MQYIDFYRELTGTIPKSSDFLAKRWVNRAKRDIFESRFWSFNRAFGYLQIPQGVGQGTFTVTQFATTVTADATATTALTGLANPVITSRQIRFTGSGPVYNIVSLVGSTLTLDRQYGEGSGTGVAYQVYQCYYGTPLKPSGTSETDFIRYLSVLDPIQPWVLILNRSREWLDRRDQMRTNIGQPSTHLVSFVPETTDQQGLPTYEMWPHPTAQRYLLCTYQKRGVDFVNDTDVLPNAIPESCLIDRATWYGCNWAMAQAGVFPVEIGKALPGLIQLRKECAVSYQTNLDRAKVKDDDTMKQTVQSQAMQWPQFFNSFANEMMYQGGATVPSGSL